MIFNFYICSDYYELSKTKTSRQYDSFILDESKSVPKQNVQKDGTVRNISQKFYNLKMENNEIGQIQQSPADPKHYRYAFWSEFRVKTIFVLGGIFAGEIGRCRLTRRFKKQIADDFLLSLLRPPKLFTHIYPYIFSVIIFAKVTF